MVNRGEEKVWVQTNVVPRSTGNTNSGTRELTLKCKLKCYFKPMNNPLGVSPSKGKQGTTRGKEKSFDLGGNRTHDLRNKSTYCSMFNFEPKQGPENQFLKFTAAMTSLVCRYFRKLYYRLRNF